MNNSWQIIYPVDLTLLIFPAYINAYGQIRTSSVFISSSHQLLTLSNVEDPATASSLQVQYAS